VPYSIAQKPHFIVAVPILSPSTEEQSFAPAVKEAKQEDKVRCRLFNFFAMARIRT
jgi:hypothetical protein